MQELDPEVRDTKLEGLAEQVRVAALAIHDVQILKQKECF